MNFSLFCFLLPTNIAIAKGNFQILKNNFQQAAYLLKNYTIAIM